MLSVQDLIKNRVKTEEKEITLKLDKFGGEIRMRVPQADEIHEYNERFNKDMNLICNAMIYENCLEPKLNDEILLQTLGCKEDPKSVVQEIFGANIKFEILEKVMDEIDTESTVHKVAAIKN